ncbi:hypothetical protein ACFQ5D_10530 [Paenibacillus farraposensis]|uniref:Uncharacterized protein n=1 Tax=Paenibacillus farraposensis TaxID=2807095 RepID=A0ABW4DDV0_9BACL|nr:hypothetical protein [Paenibacillus farraposensis]MCC3380660.1 hypothetical protein [Paenibacillus farraposensis]
MKGKTKAWFRFMESMLSFLYAHDYVFGFRLVASISDGSAIDAIFSVNLSQTPKVLFYFPNFFAGV